MSHSIQINSTSENQNSRYRIKGCQSWCERVWFIEFGHSGLVSYVYYSCPFLCVYRQSTSQSSSCFAKIHLHKIYGLSILIWIVNPPRLCSTNRSFPYYIVILSDGRIQSLSTIWNFLLLFSCVQATRWVPFFRAKRNLTEM